LLCGLFGVADLINAGTPLLACNQSAQNRAGVTNLYAALVAARRKPLLHAPFQAGTLVALSFGAAAHLPSRHLSEAGECMSICR
jgi:hypothetical protein